MRIKLQGKGPGAGNSSLVVIFITIVLDAVGMGLIFPILPSLLKDVTHVDNVAPYIGVMVALYAAIQFVCAPILGGLSDRRGRRPVILVSLAGATVNYVFLAFAPNLWMLLVGRAIAGLTSSNVSVAAAYLIDISTEDRRPRHFGLFNAMFGIGFIIGPILGGTLGDHWLRLPFVAAAALSAGNFCLACLMLRESQKPTEQNLNFAELSPLTPMRWVFSMKKLMPITFTFFIFSVIGEAYGVCWSLWGYDTFHWNGFLIGLSLGAFGVCQALAQVFLPGPAVNLLGERATILLGVASACIALIVMAFATKSWIIFVLMPLFALGDIGTPALQSMATRQVDDSQQGQFQGVLASAVSFASIVGPLTFSSIYFCVRGQWPGAIWLSVVLVYAIAIPFVLRLRLNRSTEAGKMKSVSP